MIIVKKKGTNKFINEWAKFNEFDCNCNDKYCLATLIHLNTVERYSKLCDMLGTKVKIVSAYRCQQENKDQLGNIEHSSIYGGHIVLECPRGTQYALFRMLCFKIFEKAEEVDNSSCVSCDSVRI